MDIRAFWQTVLKQDAEGMRTFLHPDALIRWPNTNEQFTAEEFIRANCAYPNDWAGDVEMLREDGELTITVTHVRAVDMPLSFHAISFITVSGEKITAIEEYWSDDGDAPKWRRDMRIGRPISDPRFNPPGRKSR